MAIAMLCHAWPSFAFEPEDNVLILVKKNGKSCLIFYVNDLLMFLVFVEKYP